MKCAIMQPTYFPWAGYFNLISRVDYFVFLDDVQFQKSSWHNRNKVLVNGMPTWLTVPVIREFLGQKIGESKLDDTKSWRNKHCNLLFHNYGKHPFYEEILSLVQIIQDESYKTLSSLNIKIIKELSFFLNLKTQFIQSSELEVVGTRTNRLINICRTLNCDEYISPMGAKDYLEEDNFSQMTEIILIINNFIPKTYPQINLNSFISHLSILDVLANIGIEKTKEYII